jgi:hypothetical protein
MLQTIRHIPKNPQSKRDTNSVALFYYTVVTVKISMYKEKVHKSIFIFGGILIWDKKTGT